MLTLLMIIFIVWIALPFVAYPLSLWLKSFLASEPIKRQPFFPSIDLVICAHNEESCIKQKLENVLALDYPRDKLTIWVASDGSTDRTHDFVQEFVSDQVHLLVYPRQGKVNALNSTVVKGTAEVIAFSDANSNWDSAALRTMTSYLGSDSVGGVAGNQVYSNQSTESVGERGYWRFDRLLKVWQATSGNVVSATGAIYCIRRELFQLAPTDATDDFMISTGVVEAGRRLAFAPGAIAEETAASGQGEFRRKVRIITRGLRSVYYRRALLNPKKFGLYSVELFLHKVLRRTTFIPFFGLMLLTPLLVQTNTLTATIGIACLVVLFLGILGEYPPLRSSFKPASATNYLLRVNAACAVAFLNTVRGLQVSKWEQERPGPGQPRP